MKSKFIPQRIAGMDVDLGTRIMMFPFAGVLSVLLPFALIDDIYTSKERREIREHYDFKDNLFSRSEEYVNTIKLCLYTGIMGKTPNKLQ